MAHGHPDYGGAAPLATVYTLQDLAELAARLGSIDVFDRRGNVLLLDDFESGIKKWLFGGTGSYSAGWICDRAEHGGFCLSIQTEGAATSLVSAYRYLAYPVLSKHGVEFRIYNKQNWKTLEIDLDRYDGSQLYLARVHYNAATHEWTYLQSDGSYSASVLTHALTGSWFHVIKLVADMNTNEYIRLIVNNDSVDLSGNGVYIESDVSVPGIGTTLSLFNSNTDVAIAYIDSVIITQNE